MALNTRSNTTEDVTENKGAETPAVENNLDVTEQAQTLDVSDAQTLDVSDAQTLDVRDGGERPFGDGDYDIKKPKEEPKTAKLITDPNDDDNIKENEDKDPIRIEEKDIIQYMLQEIIRQVNVGMKKLDKNWSKFLDNMIAGAEHHAANRAARRRDRRAAREAEKDTRQQAKRKDIEERDTYKRQSSLIEGVDKLASYREKAAEERLKSTYELFSNVETKGLEEINALNIDPQVKQDLAQALSGRKIKDRTLSQSLTHRLEVREKEWKLANRIAADYVIAKIGTEAMETGRFSVNPQDVDAKALGKLTKRIIAAAEEHESNGGSRSVFYKDISSYAQEARDFTEKNLENGTFAERDKKPLPNSALNLFENKMNNTSVEEKPKDRVLGLLDSLVESQSNEEKLNLVKEKVLSQYADLDTEKQEHKRRKENFGNRIALMFSNPKTKTNLTARLAANKTVRGAENVSSSIVNAGSRVKKSVSEGVVKGKQNIQKSFNDMFNRDKHRDE